jgi:thiol:disulfide interchange protein DsbD
MRQRQPVAWLLPLLGAVVFAGAAPALSAPAADPVAVRVVAPAEPVRRGTLFRLEVVFELATPYHIYGPAEALGDPTTVEVAPSPGIAFGAPEFPPPVLKDLPALGGKITLYSKAVTVSVPAVAAADAAPGAREIALKVSYGACTDETCLRPVQGRVAVATLTVSDAPPAAAPPAALPGASATAAPAPPPGPGAPAGSGLSEGSFLGFLLACIGGGLLSLIMPCVYPLVPITLSYFVKQSGGSRGRGVALAGMYALGIVVAFTGLGMGLSLAIGARGAVDFAANPWVNLGIAAVFLVFALSLFGLFEIVLPGGVTSALAGSPRKGLLGAFILGLSFSVVTFTCTMPIASTLLGMAAGGSGFQAAAGMLAYSATMAAPFLLFGLFPPLLGAIPRAGAWMESAKVAMGFLELQLVVYYLSKSDWGWGWGVFNRGVLLALWSALALFAAAHLAGLIAIRGHGDAGRPGPGRLIAGAAALALAAVLLAGLSGASLGFVEALVPPERHPAHAAAGEPAWGDDFEAGLREAKTSGKLLFAEFTGFTCLNCQVMERTVLKAPAVQERLGRMVAVRLYTDGSRAEAARNARLQEDRFKTVALPLYVVLDGEGRELGRVNRAVTEADFLAFLDAARAGAK